MDSLSPETSDNNGCDPDTTKTSTSNRLQAEELEDLYYNSKNPNKKLTGNFTDEGKINSQFESIKLEPIQSDRNKGSYFDDGKRRVDFILVFYKYNNKVEDSVASEARRVFEVILFFNFNK